jgi:hypothetical protein
MPAKKMTMGLIGDLCFLAARVFKTIEAAQDKTCPATGCSLRTERRKHTYGELYPLNV